MGISTLPSAGSSGGSQQYEQYFTTSTTWTVPLGVKRAEVTCIGSGGGSNATGSSAGGYVKRIVDVSAYQGSTIPITVGAPAYAVGNTIATTLGNTSSFGSLLSAYGGIPGSTGVAGFNEYGTFYSPNGYPPSAVAEVVGASMGGFAALRTQPIGSLPFSSTGAYLQRSIGTSSSNYAATPSYCLLAVDNRTTYTSSDGLTWSTNATAIGAAVTVMSGVAGYFVTVTSGGTTAYYSTNGVTWNTAALPSSTTWNLIASSGTVCVAAASGTTTAAYSTNGTTWTATTLPISATSLSYAGSYLFISNGTNLYYSSNGTTWNLCTGTVAGSSSVFATQTSGIYITPNSANAGTYQYSTNGTSWSSASLPTVDKSSSFLTGSNLNATTTFVLGNNFFTNLGFGFTSTNGTSWVSADWSNITGESAAATYQPNQPSNYPLYIGNNRYVMPMYVYHPTTTAKYGAVLLSDGFVGGYMGIETTGTALGAADKVIRHVGGGSGYYLQSTYYNGTAVGNIYTTNGTPDGYCNGGLTSQGYVSTMSATHLGVSKNYGDGIDTNPIGSASGQGVVIVRYWA